MNHPAQNVIPPQAAVKSLSPLALGILSAALALSSSGCASIGAGRNPYSREVFQPRPVTRQVGVIAQVDSTYGFAVVDAGLHPSLPSGETLEVRQDGSIDGKVIAKLRVSGERMRPFLVADILEGKPAKGDIVTRTTIESPRFTP